MLNRILLKFGYKIIKNDDNYTSVLKSELSRLEAVELATMNKWYIEYDPSDLMFNFVKLNPERSLDTTRITSGFLGTITQFDVKKFVMSFQVWLSTQFKNTGITELQKLESKNKFMESGRDTIKVFEKMDQMRGF